VLDIAANRRRDEINRNDCTHLRPWTLVLVISPPKSTNVASLTYSTSFPRTPPLKRNDGPLTTGNFGRLVLVVEDDPDIRSLVAEHLLAAGFDVCRAQDGEVAMQIIRRRRPDVVCLDLNLPRISGYEVCEQIRADVAIEGVSILITSARSSLDVRVCSIEAGADAYLTKPYSLKQLTNEIERLFELRMRNRSDASMSVMGNVAQTG
jgi:two-component system phosphate regulon response regulator PhoB